jgi:hypothetical protein
MVASIASLAVTQCEDQQSPDHMRAEMLQQ